MPGDREARVREGACGATLVTEDGRTQTCRRKVGHTTPHQSGWRKDGRLYEVSYAWSLDTNEEVPPQTNP